MNDEGPWKFSTQQSFTIRTHIFQKMVRSQDSLAVSGEARGDQRGSAA